MKHNIHNAAFNKVSGGKFEDELEESLIAAADDIYGKDANNRKSSQYEDIHNGTDFFIGGGLRIDTTLNPNKDHTIWSVKEPIETKNASIEFGIRTGNGHNWRKGGTKFDEPVLVVYFKTCDISEKALECLVENISHEQMVEILNEGVGFYYDMMDELEQLEEDIQYVETKTKLTMGIDFTKPVNDKGYRDTVEKIKDTSKKFNLNIDAEVYTNAPDNNTGPER